MTVACLTLLVALGQAPAADPSALVSKLGAARYAEREEASAELVRLGRKALPALRTARDLKDPEIRTRAAALVNKIEGALLTQPSLVTLDFKNTPLSDVLKSFQEQTGMKLSIAIDNTNQVKSRRVTLHEPAPLPFWKAVDRLCDEAQIQCNPGMHAFAGGREPALSLFDGNSRLTAPVSDSGPFRATVVGLHYQRDVSFPQTVPTRAGGPRPGQPDAARVAPFVNEQCYAQIQLAAEPRLAISQYGQPRLTEAVDDKGQALVAPSSDKTPTARHASGYFGFAIGPVIQIQAALTRPVQPGTMIKSLKGVVPVSVSTRKPNPLAVPLAGASGRSFQNEDVSLTVHDIRPQANNRPPGIEVSIRPVGGNAGSPGAGIGGPDVMMSTRPDSYQQQLEIVDANGRSIPWYQTSSDPEAGRLTLTLTSPDQAAAPAEIRFYNLIRTTTEVPFEFSDVTMP